MRRARPEHDEDEAIIDGNYWNIAGYGSAVVYVQDVDSGRPENSRCRKLMLNNVAYIPNFCDEWCANNVLSLWRPWRSRGFHTQDGGRVEDEYADESHLCDDNEQTVACTYEWGIHGEQRLLICEQNHQHRYRNLDV